MRIIWALDAFEDNKELNQKMADYLTQIHKTTMAEIEPLYLLRENEIVLPPTKFLPGSRITPKPQSLFSAKC